jgi:hypothetical protein
VVLSSRPTNSRRIACARSSCRRTSGPSLKDVVGLYVDPPAHAVVLSVDEKRSHGEWVATDAPAG